MAGWTCPTTQEPNLRTAVGLWTCRGFRQWKDLEVRVVGWSWEWLCPCGGVLRSDPWNPPKDMPQPLQRDSRAAMELSGVGLHRPVWSVPAG